MALCDMSTNIYFIELPTLFWFSKLRLLIDIILLWLGFLLGILKIVTNFIVVKTNPLNYLFVFVC